ncbi:MAG: hypothetical protein ACYDAY_11355 [Candidatus Dormibacteria bacterium]
MNPANVDRSEVAAAVVAALAVLTPLIHRTGLDGWLSLDATNVTTLATLGALAVAYLIHRRDKAA